MQMLFTISLRINRLKKASLVNEEKGDIFAFFGITSLFFSFFEKIDFTKK
jgi:hypothetical protein